MSVQKINKTKNIKNANFGGMFLRYCLEPINQIATSTMPRPFPPKFVCRRMVIVNAL
jgi:hypothetical protein